MPPRTAPLCSRVPRKPRFGATLPEHCGSIEWQVAICCCLVKTTAQWNVVVHLPYTAEADEGCATGRHRAFLMDPGYLGSIDEVGILAKWDSREGLAVLLYSIYVEK